MAEARRPAPLKRQASRVGGGLTRTERAAEEAKRGEDTAVATQEDLVKIANDGQFIQGLAFGSARAHLITSGHAGARSHYHTHLPRAVIKERMDGMALIRFVSQEDGSEKEFWVDSAMLGEETDLTAAELVLEAEADAIADLLGEHAPALNEEGVVQDPESERTTTIILPNRGLRWVIGGGSGMPPSLRMEKKGATTPNCHLSNSATHKGSPGQSPEPSGAWSS